MGKLRASKSRSQGREGWCVIFYHPGSLNASGKPERVRRGLGTRDEAEADAFVGELNLLLANPEWHTPAAKERALREFNERVVSIFYDSMEAENQDGWAMRNEYLPLPGANEGYSRVLVCGSTGAGKTTFVRQVIGTDPEQERFPSTSTARTTVADLEVIIKESPFRAVVTFFSRDKVRGYVEECVVAAIMAAAEGAGERRILSQLLEHREQRFRLSYLLGTLRDATADEDDWGSDWEDAPAEGASGGVSDEDRRAMQARLQGFLNRSKELGPSLRESLAHRMELGEDELNGDHREAFFELLQEEAAENEECQALVDEILEQVEERFHFVESGSLERTRSGWPKCWKHETEDRAEFLRQVNRFSSNYAPYFGRLLTPLVQGIRVQGPLCPKWHHGEMPRLVLLDGEGLGHTSDTAISLPTAMTRRFPEVDVIALIDSAKQPMLAGPASVLRTVAAMGHDRKLMVAFTHFDEVQGDNLPTLSARKEHVRRSMDNVLTGLEPILGLTTIRGLSRNLEDRVFFLAAIDRRLEDLAGRQARFRQVSETELKRLLDACAAAILPPVPTSARPVYDMGNLVLCIASATARFQRAWIGRLGIEVRPGVRPEHWMRIKALSRRYAEWGDDQYGNMRPVADLLRELSEGLANFLGNPRSWEPDNAPDELKQSALEAVRRAVSSRLHELTSGRLQTQPLVDWRKAFHLAGPGSGSQRAREIWKIYTGAAPVVTDVPTREGIEFMDTMRELFRDAVKEAGAEVM